MQSHDSLRTQCANRIRVHSLGKATHQNPIEPVWERKKSKSQEWLDRVGAAQNVKIGMVGLAGASKSDDALCGSGRARRACSKLVQHNLLCANAHLNTRSASTSLDMARNDRLSAPF